MTHWKNFGNLTIFVIVEQHTMSDKEFAAYQAKLEKFEKEVTKSKAASKKFLVSMGVITPTGKVTKRYKGVLCTPQDQA